MFNEMTKNCQEKSIFTISVETAMQPKQFHFYKKTRLPVTRWVKLSLNFDSQSRAYK